MSAALTPSDCDLRDFPRMMLDIARLRGSAFDATLDDSAWRAGLNLWMTAWHQVPAASLENDDAALTKAAGLGRDVKTWRKIKDTALRGWTLADDGLLYHDTLAELALEAWIEKLGNRLSSAAGNAKRYGHEHDPAPLYVDIRLAAECLTALNAKSRSLSKQHVLKAIKTPIRTPPEVPPDPPPAVPLDLPPGAPLGSQGKGKEGKGLDIEAADDSADAIIWPPSEPLDNAYIDALSRTLRRAAGASLNTTSTKLFIVSPILALGKPGVGPPCDFIADVLPAVRACAAKAEPHSVNTWEYFVPAIRQARDRRLRGAPAEGPIHERTHHSASPATGRAARRGVWAEVLAEERGEGPGGGH